MVEARSTSVYNLFSQNMCGSWLGHWHASGEFVNSKRSLEVMASDIDVLIPATFIS